MIDDGKRHGSVTLIGSGEMTPSMVTVHRTLISEIAAPVKAVFLDTPAGFELNSDGISAKAIEYFDRHFGLGIEVISFKSAAQATQDDVERALRQLQHANYIFAGPGSPTYASRNWRDTPIAQAIAQRLSEGARVVLASAAAIAVGRYVLPVYEIFKVGEDPFWAKGIDLFEPYNLDLAIVPHWNNSNGGNFDTRYCFVGEPRLRLLEPQLPPSAAILGIDEHTACTLDLDSGRCTVQGVGTVTLRRAGQELVYGSGDEFQMDHIRTWQSEPAHVSEPPHEPGEVTNGFEWPDDEEPCQEHIEKMEPLIALLIEIRSLLRDKHEWGLADVIRDRLAQQGITLQDSAQDTTWQRD